MENLSWLFYLACPVGMGVVMWMMMRGERTASSPLPTVNEPPAAMAPPKLGHGLSMLGRCLDWRVLGGLAGLGLVIFMVAPGWIGAALPLLIVAACPVSMLVMMRWMRTDQLSAKQVIGIPASVSDLPPVDRLTDLKIQLATAQAWEQDLAREIAELEATQPPAIRDVARVGLATNGRVHHRT